jgi:hypothetical protein
MKKHLPLLVLAIVFCFGCGDGKIHTNGLDTLLQMSKETGKKLDNTQRNLDTILLNAKFNNLQTESLLAIVTWRFKNRDSLMYYLGMADAYSKARKIILK